MLHRPCRLTYEFLYNEAIRRNVVLERINRTYDGVRYRYELYSNTNHVGEDCVNLQDVWSALYYDPNFQKEKFGRL